ncbi:ATP-dependent DNA helicase [Trichonephila clavipes]|nr:ATP-dependent DNA helicase [Trichonephila clavipes]
MISSQLLLKVDSRLNQITGNFQLDFGGLDIILIGDLRQLPPISSTPIYKQPKQTIVGVILWRNLKFYELNEVMRQTNQLFSSILTKIGKGELDELEITLSLVFVLWKKLKQGVLKVYDYSTLTIPSFTFESRVRLGCIFFAKDVGLSPEMDPRLERKSSAPLLVICWDHHL